MIKQIIYLVSCVICFACSSESNHNRKYKNEIDLNRMVLTQLNNEVDELWKKIHWRQESYKDLYSDECILVSNLISNHKVLFEDCFNYYDSLQNLFGNDELLNSQALVQEHIIEGDAGNYFHEKQLLAYQYCYQEVIDSLGSYVNNFSDTTLQQQLIPIYQDKLSQLYLWDEQELMDRNWILRNFQDLTTNEATLQLETVLTAMVDARITVLELLDLVFHFRIIDTYYNNPYNTVFAEVEDWQEKDNKVSAKLHFLHRYFDGSPAFDGIYCHAATGKIDTIYTDQWGRISYKTKVNPNKDSIVLRLEMKNTFDQKRRSLGGYTIPY